VRLERHILKELISNFLFAAAALYFVAGVILAVQVFFVRDLPMTAAVTAAPILLFARSELLTPCAFLTGVVFTYGRLGAELEYMATQACGIHPMRVLAPVAAVGLLLTAGQWWIASYGVPDLLVRSDRMTEELTKEALMRLEPSRNEFELRDAGLYMSWGSRNGFALEDVVIDFKGRGDGGAESGSQGGLRGRAKRVELVFEPQVLRIWIYGFRSAQKGGRGEFDKGSISLRLDRLRQTSALHAKDSFLPSDVLLAAALRRRWLSASTVDVESRDVKLDRTRDRSQAHEFFYTLNRRAAWSFASLLLGLVGAPVALWFRKGTRLGGLVVAFGIFLLVYFPLARIVGDGLSERESIPFWVSAWAASFVSSILAGAFAWRLSRR
jgi:lipopolysaccharide export LptBFGC system permease protein LptF